MDGTVPKIFYNFYLNFMNFLIFLNSRGPGSKFQISSGGARFPQGGHIPRPAFYRFVIYVYVKNNKVCF